MKKLYLLILSGFLITGCHSIQSGNEGQISQYLVPGEEAAWIRNGEPLEFEGEPWYPYDGIEVLLDSEVYLLDEYKGVQFFAEKADVRPYSRLYTKFGRNKFRMFEKDAPQHD